MASNDNTPAIHVTEFISIVTSFGKKLLETKPTATLDEQYVYGTRQVLVVTSKFSETSDGTAKYQTVLFKSGTSATGEEILKPLNFSIKNVGKPCGTIAPTAETYEEYMRENRAYIEKYKITIKAQDTTQSSDIGISFNQHKDRDSKMTENEVYTIQYILGKWFESVINERISIGNDMLRWIRANPNCTEAEFDAYVKTTYPTLQTKYPLIKSFNHVKEGLNSANYKFCSKYCTVHDYFDQHYAVQVDRKDPRDPNGERIKLDSGLVHYKIRVDKATKKIKATILNNKLKPVTDPNGAPLSSHYLWKVFQGKIIKAMVIGVQQIIYSKSGISLGRDMLWTVLDDAPPTIANADYAAMFGDFLKEEPKASEDITPAIEQVNPKSIDEEAQAMSELADTSS